MIGFWNMFLDNEIESPQNAQFSLLKREFQRYKLAILCVSELKWLVGLWRVFLLRKYAFVLWKANRWELVSDSRHDFNCITIVLRYAVEKDALCEQLPTALLLATPCSRKSPIKITEL